VNKSMEKKWRNARKKLLKEPKKEIGKTSLVPYSKVPIYTRTLMAGIIVSVAAVSESLTR
jgi:hypothetical protein